VHSGSGGKKGNKQLEVWQHEWWHDGIIVVGSRQCKVEVAAKKRKKVAINWRWQLAWQTKGSAKFGSGSKKGNTSTGGEAKQQKMMVIQACMESDGNLLRS